MGNAGRRLTMRKRICGCHSHDGFQLSPEGLAQRDDVGPELAGVVATRYLDSIGSVSANGLGPEPFWPPDKKIDEQLRRFHSGS